MRLKESLKDSCPLWAPLNLLQYRSHCPTFFPSYAPHWRYRTKYLLHLYLGDPEVKSYTAANRLQHRSVYSDGREVLLSAYKDTAGRICPFISNVQMGKLDQFPSLNQLAERKKLNNVWPALESESYPNSVRSREICCVYHYGFKQLPGQPLGLEVRALSKLMGWETFYFTITRSGSEQGPPLVLIVRAERSFSEGKVPQHCKNQ